MSINIRIFLCYSDIWYTINLKQIRYVSEWSGPPKSKNIIINTGYFKQKAWTALQVKLNFKKHVSDALSYYNTWMGSQS